MSAPTLVIIPAYNDARTLLDVVRGIRQRAPELDVLVIDDASTDRTALVAAAAGAEVATLPFRLGTGSGLRTGFRHALDHGYAQVIQFDAGGRHDPAELESLLVELDRGADLVVGTRFELDDQRYRPGLAGPDAMNLVRLAPAVLGRRFNDRSSAFRGFSRPLLEHLVSTYPATYMDAVEALVIASYEGFTVAETPVVMHDVAVGRRRSRPPRLARHVARRMLVLLSIASLGTRRRAGAST